MTDDQHQPELCFVCPHCAAPVGTSCRDRAWKPTDPCQGRRRLAGTLYD